MWSQTTLWQVWVPRDWDSVLCQVPFTVSPFLYFYSYPLIAIWSLTPTSHRYAIKILLLVKLKFMAPNTWTWKKNIFPPTSFFALLLGILYCCLFFKRISLPLTNHRLLPLKTGLFNSPCLSPSITFPLWSQRYPSLAALLSTKTWLCLNTSLTISLMARKWKTQFPNSQIVTSSATVQANDLKTPYL